MSKLPAALRTCLPHRRTRRVAERLQSRHDVAASASVVGRADLRPARLGPRRRRGDHLLPVCWFRAEKPLLEGGCCGEGRVAPPECSPGRSAALRLGCAPARVRRRGSLST